MAISFNQVGSFDGVDGAASVISNPTSLQFGPDGRLYVAEQDGSINAFTVTFQNGQYVATSHEELLLTNGLGAIKSIQNHNDDGSLSNEGDRQVTGLLVAGSAENPVVYVSSSDPRIAFFEDTNLDTNSGVITRLTWNGVSWEAVDLIRGLPRSEENHSANGLVLSEDGTKLYVAVGGNTNNGAPSDFFANTGEYALSGTVLEIDLEDIEQRPVLTDLTGGQNNTSRQYVYDLPTLDDPNVANITDGVGENALGQDEAGPWGGNDGLNMAILPADAPLRIWADGFRNHFDLVLREDGQLYTVDNGSNTDLGGNPLDENGLPTEQSEAGLATNTPNNGGTGDPEPLFLLQDGGYYGHPAPARSNQQLSWTVYDDVGNPDTNLSVNSVANLADLVPEGVAIADGFLIDPSKFTGDAARLAVSGIRVPYDSEASPTLGNLGSSSNGLTEYTSNVFDGALQGSLIVTQFNGNVTLLNLNEEGTALEPLIDPTEDNNLVDDDGIFPLATGQSLPLDVTTGADGSLWIAEFGASQIKVIAPSDASTDTDGDLDGDGLLNQNDPFLRDPANGTGVVLAPNQTLLWDFDANQDGNLPGISGYGGGLTGVMINGATDYEQFFQEPSEIPGQIIQLDNVKFSTAAGGGTTVIEAVANGDPLEDANNGEFLFHTGVLVSPSVSTFQVKWSIFNPGSQLSGTFQQVGGYIGSGDQSNYLKIAAVNGAQSGVQILLEDDDTVVADSFIAAEDIFDYSGEQQIFLTLTVDPLAGAAIPQVSYETDSGDLITKTGAPLDLSGTTVLEAIRGEYVVNGQDSALAVGLLASNTGQSEANTFQAIFNDVEIIAGEDSGSQVLYRVNAGGAEILADDGGVIWSEDTKVSNSSFLSDPGSNSTIAFPQVEPGATISEEVPASIFDSERWDQTGGSEMQWAFDVAESGLYEVRLYVGNGFAGTSEVGERGFDVAVEENVPGEFNSIDPSALFGHEVGGVLSTTTTVTDGILNLEFLHGIENPMINGIEIIKLGPQPENSALAVSFTEATYFSSEAQSLTQVSLLTNALVPDGETVEVTLEIVPGTATALEDYVYNSSTASFNPETGIYTDTIAIASSSSDATISVEVLPDSLSEGNESFEVKIVDVSPNAQISQNSATVAISDEAAKILYRVNAGGGAVAAIDGNLGWAADTKENNHPALTDAGSNSTSVFPDVVAESSLAETIPEEIFDSERWDLPAGGEMSWAFEVEESGSYEVRLYIGNGFEGTSDAGARTFDVAVEGVVPSEFNSIDPSAQFGHEVGSSLSSIVEVNDGVINLEFLHGVENPFVNGIEIVQVSEASGEL